MDDLASLEGGRPMQSPRGLTGMWGEFAARLALIDCGFDVDWQGGLTAGRDLEANRGGRRLWVQVKTTTRSDAAIAWRWTGQRARNLDAKANELGAEAWFVLVHFPTEAAVVLDERACSVTVRMPEDVQVAAVLATDFADAVDSARTDYGKRVRQRAGRNGEPIGARLSEDNLLYPAYVSDFVPIEISSLAR